MSAKVEEGAGKNGTLRSFDKKYFVKSFQKESLQVQEKKTDKRDFSKLLRETVLFRISK